ncbi:MAG: hypothetical protein JNM67_08915 [Bacteroidetes bacterium]|nr:hypothetical protein [Bacteroidota bacterium]
MINNSKYKLDDRPNKRKYRCPACNQDRKFTRYIYSDSLDEIDEVVGICDRLNNCGYHFTPKEFFKANPEAREKTISNFNQVGKLVETLNYFDTISQIELEKSLNQFDGKTENHFVFYLIRLFGVNYALDLVNMFRIGFSNHWKGATIFWQIDIEQKIRTGKVILYNPLNGKRVKEPYNHVNWFHSIKLKSKELVSFRLKQCFFGEHQLMYNTKSPVAIVESEKTAILMTIYMSEYVWIASGSLVNISVEKCKVLKHRKVVLFPDLNGYDKWNEKAIELREKLGLNVSIFNWLQDVAEEEDKKAGYDIADFIVKVNESGQAIDDDGNLLWPENYK